MQITSERQTAAHKIDTTTLKEIPTKHQASKEKKKQGPNRRCSTERANGDCSTKHHIRVLLGNVQSLIPKMDEIQAIVKTFDYDVLAFNETWLDLDKKHLEAEISIQNYKQFHIDKPTATKRGGGSCLYVKHTLLPVAKKLKATAYYELIQVNIRPSNGRTIKLILVYRNPAISAGSDIEFYEELEDILSSSSESVIMGDFNQPNINWNQLDSHTPGNKLVNFVQNNNLTQHVQTPTRLRNILDLILSTENDLVNNIQILDKIGDHKTVSCCIKTTTVNRNTTRYIYDFRRANFEGM